jgi:hypothetical protein
LEKGECKGFGRVVLFFVHGDSLVSMFLCAKQATTHKFAVLALNRTLTEAPTRLPNSNTPHNPQAGEKGEYHKRYYLQNKATIKQRHLDSKEQIQEYQRHYYRKNRERLRQERQQVLLQPSSPSSGVLPFSPTSGPCSDLYFPLSSLLPPLFSLLLLDLNAPLASSDSFFSPSYF